MEEIPNEFKDFRKYLNVSKMFENVNSVVSKVMLHSYMDCCLEKCQLTTDRKIRKYLNDLMDECGDFPEDGAHETQVVADEIFENLILDFERGKISSEMAKQFFVCHILYSVLAGDECAERQDSCLFASLKINQILRKGNQVKISHVVAGLKKIAEKKPTLAKFTLKHRLNQKPIKEVPYEYNKTEALTFLKDHNLKLVPKVADADPSYESILRDISHGIEMLKAGDKKRAAAFLRKARKEWINP